MYPKIEIAIGQKLRELTHIKHFNAALDCPRAAQTARLLRMIDENKDTVFGKRYQFDRISSISDFQSLVPPATYEDLHPYIEPIMNGARGQLTVEPPVMFATTSGTTAKPKFIPITPSHLRDYTHAFQVHNYQMIKEYPQGAAGKFLIITSNDEEGRAPCGVPYGAVSGLLNRKQPAIIKKHFALPYELSKIKDVDAKYYLMLRMAACQNVTAILGCNPSSLLLLADQMTEHAEKMLPDIYDGTVNKRYMPPSELYYAFKPFLEPDRTGARRLGRILEREGTLKPKDIWPGLTLLSCWKGGPMSFYLERLPEAFGPLPIRDFGYMASEGRGSIPLTNDGAGGVLAVTSHFFEFVPEKEIETDRPTFLTADQLEVNQRYYIYFTTASGLYRYNINDLVEVVGFCRNTPVIQFIRKGLGMSSVTGEKLTEEHVKIALTDTVRQLNLTGVADFTARAELGTPPYYTCFVELKADLPHSVRDEFLRVFDLSLQTQNIEYEDKRATRRLGAPVLQVVPAGTYTRLRQLRVSQGAPEAQVKIPMLASYGQFQLSKAGQLQ